ncbi:hypothetical protein [Microseira sp. BLCC-F43]|jgi:hypothetical protein|uniref:hypothetical protein n=1 Tax=Microseira sp. BLCC-F43 TaxID=3153602 RepID=UPI0035B7FC1F
MLTYHRKPISLSLVSTDLPIWSMVETAATLYQKDRDRFHLLMNEPAIGNLEPADTPALATASTASKERLLWLEISPHRAIMTMQGNGRVSYRHFWERGVYGLSRYWLQSETLKASGHMRLRNFTRSLKLVGGTLPESLRLEYELWSEKVQLGCYILNLEIHH